MRLRRGSSSPGTAWSGYVHIRGFLSRSGLSQLGGHVSIQAGLATKVEKASRKLRKERKNRSKKVRYPSCLPPNRLSSFSVLSPCATVPWHQKGQGCRATEEGQIVGSPRCYGLLLLSSSHCMFIIQLSWVYPYRTCLSFSSRHESMRMMLYALDALGTTGLGIMASSVC